MANCYQELRGVLRQQYALYPEMQLIDVIKLIYQSEFAGGHMISDEAAALQRLEDEWTLVQRQGVQAESPVFEELGDGLCRLNLSAIVNQGITPATVNRLFVLSANKQIGSVENFERKLAALRQWCIDGLFPWVDFELDAYLKEYKAQGYPAVSHSQDYRSAYAPAYRVISSAFRPLFELLVEIDRMSGKQERVTLAIDGPSASGKTTLASSLAQIYDCSVIHMDHFFLPNALRTKARLNEPGGNIDYDRFVHEVVEPLQLGEVFSYGVYDCTEGKIVSRARVANNRLTVIEGVYSMHPKFIDSYSFKVFLQVNKKTQSERILARNGANLHQRFLQEWIPLEYKYFTTHKIAEQADLTLTL